MDKIPIKAVSVAEARKRLSKLKPLLIETKELYTELVVLESILNKIKPNDDLSQLLIARKNVTIKEDDLIDIQEKFRENDCIIKDAATGLIDFIGIRKGRPVWLCFKEGEEELEYFHEWDAGYIGRKSIDFH